MKRHMRAVTVWLWVGLLVGQHPVQVIASGDSPPSPTPVPMPSVPAFPTDSVVPTDSPIELPGSAAVTDNGGATYSIPLRVPEGPAGLTPNMSIEYAGTANGRLGVGMRLTGLSSIVPCGKRLVSEGVVDGIDLDARDALCLDGTKLVFSELFDTGSFAVQGRLYHTEVESFARIVRYDDGIKRWFEVRDPRGTIDTYVEFTADRLAGPPSDIDGATLGSAGTRLPVAYLRTRTEDRYGNAIVYKFETSADNDATHTHAFSPRISEIQYSFSGATPRRYVRFIYEARPDINVTYSSGIQTRTATRLAAIEMWAPNPSATARVWTYTLQYKVSPDTRRSLLASVKMCDQTAACTYVRSFSYTTSSAPLVDRTVGDVAEFSKAALWQSPIVFGFIDPASLHSDIGLAVFDSDGDGYDDILYRTEDTKIEPTPVHWPDPQYDTLTRGKLYMRRAVGNSVLADRQDVSGVLEPWGTNDYWKLFLSKSRVADRDGDGVSDFLAARTHVAHVDGMYWTDGGQQSSDPKTLCENQNKTCYHDNWTYGYSWMYGPSWAPAAATTMDKVAFHGPVFRAKPGATYDYWYFGTLFDVPAQRVLADLDGDGRVDEIDAFDAVEYTDHPSVDWSGMTDPVYQLPYYAQVASDDSSLSLGMNWTCGNGRMRVTDMDGDGRDDVLASTVQLSSPRASAAGVYSRAMLGDPDVGNVNAAITTEANGLWGGDCGARPTDLVLGDFNGDGLQDALYPPETYISDDAIPWKHEPLVRWNTGNGYAPSEPVVIEGPPELKALLYQRVPVSNASQAPAAWDRGTRAVDLNGDGRTDILAFRLQAVNCANADWYENCDDFKTVVVAYISTGDHFVGQIVKTWDHGGVSIARGFSTAQVGDVNGDGAPDAVHVVDGRIHFLELPFRQDPDRLAQVDDSGVAFPLAKFQYRRDWWGKGPRPAEPCGYPLSCMRHGSTVVWRLETFTGTRPDNTAMYRRTIHRYEDGKVDLRGRGFLGFGRHRIWDIELGRETIIDHDNATAVQESAAGATFYPYAGRPTRVMTITPTTVRPNPNQLTELTSLPGLYTTAILPVRIVTTTTSYELRWSVGGRVLTVLSSGTSTKEAEGLAASDGYQNQTTEPMWVTGVTTTFRERSRSTSYDEYGNPTHELLQTLGGQTLEIGDTQETWTTYENRTDDWLLGLPSHVATRAYGPNGAMTTPERSTDTTYDAAGQVATISVYGTWPHDVCAWNFLCEDGRLTATFARNARGVIIATTSTADDDPDSRSSWVTWDAESVYPTSVTDALGFQTVALTHPALGAAILGRDANGIVTNFKIDGFGRTRHRDRAGTASIDRSYAPYVSGSRRGVVATEVGVDGSKVKATHDELGRPIESRRLGFANLENVSTIEYDVFGDAVFASRPGVNQALVVGTTSSFDRLGRPLVRTTPDNQQTFFTHTPLGSKTTDPLQHQSYVQRDLEDRVVETGHTINGSSYGKLKFTYGAFGQVDRITDALGRATTNVYDALGRRTRVTEPDAGITYVDWNGFGEPVRQERANGDVVTTTYDKLGRVKSSTSPDGTTTWAWDTGQYAAHQLVSQSSPDGVTDTYAYDYLGRMRETVRTIGPDSFKVSYGYDTFSRIRNVFYPEVAAKPRFTLSYDYTPQGYLSQISDVSSCGLTPPDAQGVAPVKVCAQTPLWHADARNADLALEQATFGNGVTVQRIHDSNTGRLQKLGVASLGYSTSYNYDQDGNVSQRLDGTGRKELFTYDPLHRLQDWDVILPTLRGEPAPVQPGKILYTYDEVGNLYDVTRAGTQVFHGVLESARPHVFSSTNVDGIIKHDDNGRETITGSRTIAYTPFDLPRQVTANGVQTLFTYDAMHGRARKQVVSQSVTTYVGELYERRVDATGTQHVFYVSADPGVVAQVAYTPAGTVKRYYVSDDLGTTTLTLDGAGAVTEKSFFDPFGSRVDYNAAPAVDADPATTIGYGGHQEDSARLVDMRGRIYDRAQYRFLTPDPLVVNPRFGQSWNPYSYVLNNPLRYFDPSGLGEEGAEPDSTPMPDDVTGDDEQILVTQCVDANVCGGANLQEELIDADAASGTPTLNDVAGSLGPVYFDSSTVVPSLRTYAFGEPGKIDLPMHPEEDPPPRVSYPAPMCGGSPCGDAMGTPAKILTNVFIPATLLIDLVEARNTKDAVWAGIGLFPLGQLGVVERLEIQFAERAFGEGASVGLNVEHRAATAIEIEAAKAYYNMLVQRGWPGLAGVAGHRVLGAAERGADVLFPRIIEYKFKNPFSYVSGTDMEQAMKQAMGYWLEHGHGPPPMVTFYEMASGNVYDITIRF